MRGICPNCEKTTELEHIRTTEEFNVRGEFIPVSVEYYKCLECEETFEDPRSKEEPLAKAYKEYRRRCGMLLPEEIRDLRKRYGLIQKELSELLGWGGATLSRYENGALQDQSHDRILQLVKNPENMLRLINNNGDFLPNEKRERLLGELEAAVQEAHSLPNIFVERFGSYKPDQESGYRKLELNKLFEAIKFFSQGGVFKSKLCKLLFYGDFKHFKDCAVSITGARYAHGYHGPVPDKYEYYFANLIHDEKSIRVEERGFDNYSGDYFIAEVEPDLAVFSSSELDILHFVKRYFQDFTAKRIREFSHKEVGYNETYDGEIISYQYAEQLQI